MKVLYEIGVAVWYYDVYDGCVGIGIVFDYNEDPDNMHRNKTTYYTHHFEYAIWDPNTDVMTGGYDNPSLISLTAKDIAPLECYNSQEEFLKSRGADPKSF